MSATRTSTMELELQRLALAAAVERLIEALPAESPEKRDAIKTLEANGFRPKETLQ
jgi:hypothetical protein